MFLESIFELLLVVMQGIVPLTPPIIPDLVNQVLGIVTVIVNVPPADDEQVARVSKTGE